MPFARGFSAGLGLAQVRNQRAQIQNQRAQIQQKQNKVALDEANKMVDENLSIAATLIENGRLNEVPDEKIREKIKAFIDGAKTHAFLSNQLGGGNSPELVDAKVEALFSAPTPAQVLKQKKTETRELATTRAEVAKEQEPIKNERTVIISGDSETNKKFGLGIVAGKNERVKFTEFKDGTITANVLTRAGEGQTINIKGGQVQTAFEKQLGEDVASEIKGFREAGIKAAAAEPNFIQLADLLADPSLQTGSLQPALTSLQGIAADLGVDMATIAKRFGINLGELSEKQEFDRLAMQVIIDGFEKFKGNLNQKEVDLAIGAFANLGTSENANIEAIAFGLAAQQVAKDFAAEASKVTTKPEADALLRTLLGDDTTKFITLKNKFAQDMRDRRGGLPKPAEKLPEGIPEGSVLINNEEGKDFYKAPDGKIWVVE